MNTFITTIVIRSIEYNEGFRHNSAFKAAIWGGRVCLTFNPEVKSDTEGMSGTGVSYIYF